jgi:hypothetical protein
MQIKFLGNYTKLKRCVSRTRLKGEWRDLENRHKQYRTGGGAVLNWWQATGTITFQGHGSAAKHLEQAFIAVASAKGRIETKNLTSLAAGREENDT